MALTDPVAIFTASSNIRARALCHALVQSGIEAHVIEDVSLGGLWVGGTLPGIHSPKIWVDRAEAEHAAAILQEHEQREADLQTAPPPADDDQQVQTVCEECGGSLAFPASQRGSVQECLHCGSYVDVVADDEVSDWGSEEESA
ncbi:MAG: hypothetical protein ACJ8FY_09670 [Gemmataceae bacterium]